MVPQKYRCIDILTNELASRRNAALQKDRSFHFSLGLSCCPHSKKRWGKPRFDVDDIKLKALTSIEAYILPTMQEIWDSLAGSVAVSTTDLNSGYWQWLMDENHLHLSCWPLPILRHALWPKECPKSISEVHPVSVLLPATSSIMTSRWFLRSWEQPDHHHESRIE